MARTLKVNGALYKRIAVRIEDVDGDGDADVVLYAGATRLGSIEFSTLASNVAAETRRIVRRVRKATKK